MANTMGASAVAERHADALWLAALPVPRVAATRDRLPAMRHANVRPAVGVLCALPGAVTDMTVTRDGRHLVAAHYGDDAVSVIDIDTLTVSTVIDDIAEPYALAAADRIYVTSAADAEDSVVAVDPAAGVALAAKDITVTARGLAVSPSGDTLYVARCGDAGADIAAIDIESGVSRAIALTGAAGAAVDTVRVSADGTVLFAALTTVAVAAPKLTPPSAGARALRQGWRVCSSSHRAATWALRTRMMASLRARAAPGSGLAADSRKGSGD